MSKLVGVTGVRALLPIVWQLGFALGSVVGGLRWAGIARVILISMGTLTGVGGTTSSIISSCQQNPSTCNLRCLFGLLCSPPIVKAIELPSTSLTGSANESGLVKFKIQFSQVVTGVDDKDFELISSGSIKNMKLDNVAPENANTNEDTYIASVDVGTGNGTIQLNLKDDDSIKNSQNVPLGGDGAGNGNFSGPEYSTPSAKEPATPPPSVVSINPVDSIFTNQPEVSYDVQFDQEVTGVDLSDFQLSSQPLMAHAQLSRWQEQSPKLYRVFVTTGLENYSKSDCFQLKLTLKDDNSIKNSEGTPLGGTGIDNDVASGEINSQVVCGAMW